jgi:hypothetical protein
MSRATRLKKKRKQARVAQAPCKHCELTAVCLPLPDTAVHVDHCVYCGESKLLFHARLFHSQNCWVTLPMLLQRTCPRVVEYAAASRRRADLGPPCCTMGVCLNKRKLEMEERERHLRAAYVQRIQELGDTARMPAKRGRAVPRLRNSAGGQKLFGRKSYRPLDEEK